MELQQVRYFLALARCLNFTRAAEQCNVTQPALTKAIQKLESELGGDLIYRERNLTQLTQLGKLILPMFERTLAAADATLLRAAEYCKRQIAPLRIGLGPDISSNILVVPLRDVTKTLPSLAIELVDAPLGKAPSLLLEGEIDAAITVGVDSADSDRLDRWHLFEERLVVLMPRGHPLTIYDTIPRDKLSDVVWLDCAEREVARTQRDHCRLPQAATAAAHRALQPFQLLPLIAAGMGVMLGPQHMPLIDGIVARAVGDPCLCHQVCMIAVAGRQHTPSLAAFIKVMGLHDWTRELDPHKPQAAAVQRNFSAAPQSSSTHHSPHTSDRRAATERISATR